MSVGEEKASICTRCRRDGAGTPECQTAVPDGVGMPEDLVEGVARGIDMFDCGGAVRYGRTGWLFTSFGRVVIKQAQYLRDEQPIDPACPCPVCAKYSRAYLHHLFGIKEISGSSVEYDSQSMVFRSVDAGHPDAIKEGLFNEFRRRFYETYKPDQPAGESRESTCRRDWATGGRTTLCGNRSRGRRNIRGIVSGSSLLSLVPFVLIFVIFYFMLILPQQKRQKQLKSMIEGLKKGDKVVT
ncbi:MAG: preprotein translocase subunit YajC [Nitrospiraceae bacterium]